MFKKLLKNKKAQNTAEYALLIALVVAGIIAMQTYAQRGLQARIRDAVKYMVDNTSGLGDTEQYEPYYLRTDYKVTRDNTDIKRLGTNLVSMEVNSLRTRAKGGFQESVYTAYGLDNLI